MKMIVAGVWACVVIATVNFALKKLDAPAPKASDAAAATKLVTAKTRELNVPKIENGGIKGYIVTQLTYTLTSDISDKSSTVDALVSDRTFKFLYAYTEFDLDHLQGFDLNKLTDYVKNNVNAALGSPGLTNVGIAEFTFVPSADAKPTTPTPLETRP